MRAGISVAVVLVALLAGGCASGDFSIRSLPPDTPAAANAVAIDRARQIQAQRAAAAPQAQIGVPITAADVPSIETYDPWERMNRFTYRFNASFDEAIFLPVANGYGRLPDPMRQGVHNFFANLSEVVSVINYAVQLRPVPGVRSLGRFVINTTFGLGGLFDVAEKMNLRGAPTGFGSTLARWGVHPGPYLVMPLLGPSTLRDGLGFCADFGTSYAINLAHLYRGNVAWALTPLNAVDIRSNTSFRYYSTGSAFEYDTVRFLYVRQTLIEDEGLRLWQRAGNSDPHAPAGK